MQKLDYRVINFVHLLRILGIRVSVAETLDAIQGLTYTDLSSKSQVKAVLRATLLKNMDQLPLFEEAFNAYFSTPEVREQKHGQRQETELVQAQELAQAEAELNFQGQTLELATEQKQLYNKLPEVGKQRIQDFLQRSSEGTRLGEKLDQSFKPIVENLVRGHLDYWKRQLGEEHLLFDLPPEADANTNDLVRDVADSMREHESNYLYEDLKNIADKDLPKVNLLIRKLSKRLASRISRRYHSSKRVGQVELRRTIRSSLTYGGALVELKYKRKPRTKPRFLLLCDVSGSMARYASFVLQFIYGLSSVVKGIESFVFSEDLERVTPDFFRGQNFEETMVKLMNRSQEWGGGTNLAKALDTLVEEHPGLVTKDTVIIIVSDTKTLEARRAAMRLEDLGEKAKEILWLNTLPKKNWPQHKSVKEFKDVCLMCECYTLAHLEKIMTSRFI